MPTPLRAALVLAAATVAMSACSSDSSSGPAPLTAAQLAAHYDSLASALDTSSTTGDQDMGNDVALFNGVIADGILPTKISVTVGGQQQTWYGTFVNWIFSGATDSAQVGLLWKDTQGDAFVGFVFEDAAELSGDVGILALGGSYLTDSAWTYTGTFTEGSGACSYTPITNVPSFEFGVTTYGNTSSITSCTPATASLAGTFYSESGNTTASAALQSFTFNQQTINGVRLATNVSAQHVVQALRAQAAAGRGVWIAPRK
jgi:hypothetical protein